ncbi:ribonucleoprotein Sm D1 [Seminavis robusta]|uniref:snRNP core protein D1 n=1 Tax=Seminavis robusta TaxID=568900 RepID=A0A9N8EQL1_9STRA|nr:ribonucleoprotein Sm D1 [Seminavis robusta]|eukprot:Sro1419_g271040.1 ribonucleoprotein Sm D1 (151) ;mRNA; f:3972-4771
MKLVKFLQKLNREQVTIELKNGTVVQGTVVGVDATMNCHLKKAKVTVRGKNPVSYATLSVRGSTMRSWLLPESLNLDALLVDDAPKKTVAPKSLSARDSGRGRGRAKRIHDDILDEERPYDRVKEHDHHVLDIIRPRPCFGHLYKPVIIL